MRRNRRAGRVADCACCDRSGQLYGRGLIESCYNRHYHAGTLEEYPTQCELNMQEYLPWHAAGVSARIAAARIGVTPRTITRLRARLREQAS